MVAFSGRDLSVLASFYAYDTRFHGGVRVAAGDVNGDGLVDIVTGAGPTGSPHVAAFSGSDLSILASFYAYNPAFVGGVHVTAGDFNGDGRAEIVTAPDAGGSPHVIIFAGTGTALGGFYAFDERFLGGVNLATGDLNSDGWVDLIMGSGQGAAPVLRVLSGVDGSELSIALPPGVACGVGVGSVGDAEGVAITSSAMTSFTVGTAGTFTITTTGQPVPALSATGALPAGVTFTDNGDRTGTLSGTPVPLAGGSYPLVFTATNGVAPPVAQPFTLLVMELPAITSAAGLTAGGAEQFVNLQYSFIRNISGGGVARDTDTNSADFMSVDTNGTLTGIGQRLGTPSPRSTASPARRDQVAVGAIPGQPTEVRDTRSTTWNIPGGGPVNSPSGVLSFPLRLTNNTGQAITRLRMRIIELTTFPSNSGTSDLRVFDGTGTVTDSAGTVVVSGLRPMLVELPTININGGGVNTTLSLDTTALPGGNFGIGATVDVHVRFGVAQEGNQVFNFVVETLP